MLLTIKDAADRLRFLNAPRRHFFTVYFSQVKILTYFIGQGGSCSYERKAENIVQKKRRKLAASYSQTSVQAYEQVCDEWKKALKEKFKKKTKKIERLNLVFFT